MLQCLKYALKMVFGCFLDVLQIHLFVQVICCQQFKLFCLLNLLDDVFFVSPKLSPVA